MDAAQLKRLKELEFENQKLKQMYADLSMDNLMLYGFLSSVAKRKALGSF